LPLGAEKYAAWRLVRSMHRHPTRRRHLWAGGLDGARTGTGL